MKRFVVVLAAIMVVGCLAACSSSQGQKTGGQQIANPMESSTQQGIVDAMGINLPAPEGATDVQYFIYKTDKPIAEMRFTLDGKKAFLRAQPTSLTDLSIGSADAKQGGSSDAASYDISGLNYKWEAMGTQIVRDLPALFFVSGKVGYIAWVDVAPGVLYNLGMEDGASNEVLTQMAEAAFVPMQGNVG